METTNKDIKELEKVRGVIDLKLSLNKIESDKMKKQRKEINDQIQSIINNTYIVIK